MVYELQKGVFIRINNVKEVLFPTISNNSILTHKIIV